MPADADFMLDPVGFMSANIVLQTVGGKAVVGTTGLFTLAAHQGPYKGKNTRGKKCPIYELRQAVGGGISAYWCPYANDEVNSVTLDALADYMFTAKMDGCSFGVGMPGIGGAVRVAHANESSSVEIGILENQIGNEMNLERRAALQIEKLAVKSVQQIDQLSDALDFGVTKTLGPLSYADRGYKSTTFGVRAVNGTWSFSYHLYKFAGINHELIGCLPLM